MGNQRQVNKLTNAQQFALWTWLKEQQLKEGDTLESLTTAAQKFLNFQLTSNNVSGSMDTMGMKIPGKPKNADQKLDIALHAIATLYLRLNEAMPEELAALARK